MNLALFDFDGTITTKEMFTDFIHFATSKRRSLFARALLLPWLLLYKAGWYPAKKLRPLVAYMVFKGKKYQQINALGARYAQEVIPNYLRDQAMARIRWHQAQGDQVVVVSASLDMYLRHWCQQHGVQLICSELAVRGDKLSGYFVAGDCSRDAKATKVLAQYHLESRHSNINEQSHQKVYKKIYAYGDTHEDLAMLALADEKYMNWQLVD